MAQIQSEARQGAAGQAAKGATGQSPTDPKSDPADLKNPRNGPSTASDADPTELLKSDHRQVEQLFSLFEKAMGDEQKSQLAKQICTELMVHTLIEEELFYPACKGHMEQNLLQEAQVEHDGAKTLIIEIRGGKPDDLYFDAKVKVLSEEIKHHVREEEKSDGILAKAKQAGVATPELAKQMQALKQELMGQAKAGTLGPPETRSFRVRTFAGMNQQSQEQKMARGSSMTMERERDERGRFVSDDEDDRDYRRRSSSRSRYDDDDDDRRSSRSRSTPARDDEGRFTSSRSRYDDDDYRHRSMPARDDEGRFTSRGRAMTTTMMTGAAAGATAAGMAIPRAIRERHGAAGKSVAVHAAAIETTMPQCPPERAGFSPMERLLPGRPLDPYLRFCDIVQRLQ
jgi:hypothetical protein